MMTNKTAMLLLISVCISCLSSFAGYSHSFFLKDDTTVIDMGGRAIHLEKPFKRIVSLYGAHTENLFYLGLDQEIIGVTKSDAYPERAKTKKRFSSKDDPEKYLVENPDLILIRPMLERGYADLFTMLEKKGITVVSLQPKNITEMYLYWRILGMLTGREHESIKMIQKFKIAIKEFNQLTMEIPAQSTVYFEAVHKKMKTFTRGAMADFVLITAGGINIANDGQSSRGTNIAIYGKEKIVSKGSQIDVFIAQKGPMNQITHQMIVNEPGFKLIKAVQNNKIYIVDETIVSRPTLRLLEGIKEIGTYLYPEVFQVRAITIVTKACEQ